MGQGTEETPSGIPTNWIEASQHESVGRDIRLASLTPKFDEASHGVYFDLLTRAVDASGVRNVALTGAYGTGKSSVLEELRRKRGADVIELSLSTITLQRQEPDSKDGQSRLDDDKSKTNLIQKEIVKQLLYRLPAHKTPRSRFRRTSAPQTKRDWILSAGIGLSVVAVAFLLGLLQPPVEFVVPEPWGRRLLAYVLLIGGVSGVAWLILGLITRSSIMSASVGTGLTSVTLSSNTDTYFDQYLDEIVYFFQASKTKIVVIEDIDRFEDVQVFDTLRALNVLLNSSSVLDRIVFVYAIRDSVFEQLDSVANSSDQFNLSKRKFEITNRSKFFDVIIPVVPFVNADNARDLMSRAMDSPEFSINEALIRISARHLADMRLIYNIRNEFEVYRSRLIKPKRHLYGITDDLVFAMIVFKNAHLADFEKIRHKESNLDHLYASWRELVEWNLGGEIHRLSELRSTLEHDDGADERARRWGQSLLEHVETMRAGLQRTASGESTLSFVGDFNEEAVCTRAFWQEMASGAQLKLQLYVPNPYQPATVNLVLSSEQLGTLLNITVDPNDWGEPVRSELESEIEICEERIRFLRHHTWEELCHRPEFVLMDSNGTKTFGELVRDKLRSPLADELVQRGFITSHFALYTSTYYGTHLGPEALEYVRRCIEPGVPDTFFVLEGDAIEQLLIEQKADKDDDAEIFDDVSILNVSILNYLLEKRPGAAEKVVNRLAAWGKLESEFVAAYCTEGEHPDLLLAKMAPNWHDVVQYAASGAPLPSEKRIPTLDLVLEALPRSGGYRVGEDVRHIFESAYSELKSVTSPASQARAAIVLDVVGNSSATIGDVGLLNDIAREEVVARSLYPVTKNNLKKLTESTSIALDVLLRLDKRVYDHAIGHLDDYLHAFTNSEDTKYTIDEPSQFSRIVTDAGKHGSQKSLRTLVEQSSVDCRVDSLAEVPAVVWPTILFDYRTSSSFANIYLYLTEIGSIDDQLGEFLSASDAIKWDSHTASLEDRQQVSLAILGATGVLPGADERVDLVVQLKPGQLPISEIQSESGGFVSRLIEEGLISDDAETFSSKLMVDWTTREAAIRVSSNFESFLSPETMPVAQIPEMLVSSKVSSKIKIEVVEKLGEYLTRGTQQQAEQIARKLNDERPLYGAPSIQALIAKDVSATQIIPLIVRNTEISVDVLQGLLRSMEEPYSRLADPGTRPVFISDDPDHRKILVRLDGVTVSTFRSDKKPGGKLRVNLRKN